MFVLHCVVKYIVLENSAWLLAWQKVCNDTNKSIGTKTGKTLHMLLCFFIRYNKKKNPQQLWDEQQK